MTITFIGTLNIHSCPSGYRTNTSRHNALRIRRISEANLRREEEICLKATNKRSQKTLHVSSGNDHRYPIFCGQTPLDTQLPSSYTPTMKKEVLINFPLPVRRTLFLLARIARSSGEPASEDSRDGRPSDEYCDSDPE